MQKQVAFGTPSLAGAAEPFSLQAGPRLLRDLRTASGKLFCLVVKEGEFSLSAQEPAAVSARDMSNRYRRIAPAFFWGHACRAAFLNLREEVLAIFQLRGELEGP